MDSFELNKVAGAVLGALLFAVGSGFVAELIYHPKPAGNAGYRLPEPEAKSGGAAAEAPKAEPIAVRLASADAEKGKGGTKACQACHSFEKGGPNKVGPDLWEIVEREKAHAAGFDYSAALKEKGGTWTYEDLDHFLESPKGYVKGTKMAFAGIGSPTDRANVIAYLRTLADSPKPLPAAEKKAETAPAGDKKAEAEKPAEGKPDAKKAAEEKKPAGTKPVESATGDKGKTPETNAPQGNTQSGDGKDTARPVPAPQVQPQRNEVAPTQAPEAKPSGDIPTKADPGSESTPATEPPAKPDPDAPKP
ncbi:putative membrane cytochrome c [Methylorubrum extorquens]|uniref:Putative membrane cytochrome c n=1 Tax=Methylorubrum extorquens TaxID=408 RepID=A0A2N9AZL2_METEX|nr:cytochrome c family protein [Methylorubrum zatmanii]ARO54269.1 cytochrome C [Methylorubrum zatmanii]SOR32738.1 putative membrane cytochrome c [Methylorubrum extorquens]